RDDVNLEPGVVVHFLIERPAVPGIEPGQIPRRIEAEGVTGEERAGGNLRRPEARGREARIDLAVGYLGENLVGLGPVARLLQLEEDGAGGALLDELCEPCRGLAEAGEMGAVNHGSDEAHRLRAGRRAGRQ